MRERVKVINLLSFVIVLLATFALTLVICFLVFVRLSWGFSSWQPIWPFPLIVVLLACLAMTAHALVQTIRILGKLGKNVTLFSQGTLKQTLYYGLVMAIALTAIMFVSHIAWSLTHEQPPDFFPFDDPEATYTIVKSGDKFMLIYDSKGDRNVFYTCDRMSGKTNCQTRIDRHIEVMIGKSKTELQPLIGKQVEITGDFTYRNKQCIAGNCQDIGNWAVLDIYSITEVE